MTKPKPLDLLNSKYYELFISSDKLNDRKYCLTCFKKLRFEKE